MQLRALEIQGFKSFPDKTVLHFDAAISAVVGPNGSGKSNISDAIRWVLGEQSTRALRGGKMEDVIFGGTQRRKSQGFAEVTLTLDNTDGTLDHPESELSVTRRYYRSGESSYLINRQGVRLRDVNELFMDTGLGQEGYALIGQGKIDEILSQKSGERREIFEEAAGISRYRHRKEEAERKLLHTRDNLLRIRDKLEELDLQLTPLKRQAEKAERYGRLRDALRSLEVSLWMQRLAALRAALSQQREDLSGTQTQLSAAQAESARLYDQSESLLQAVQVCDLRLAALRREDIALEEENAVCSQRRSVLQVQMENLRESQAKLTREGETQSTRCAQISETRRMKEAALQSAREAASTAAQALQALEEQSAARQAELQSESLILTSLQTRSEQENQAEARVLARLSALDAAVQEMEARGELLARSRVDLLTQIEAQQESARLLYQSEQTQAAELEEKQALLRTRQEKLQAAKALEESKQERWLSLRMEENALSARLRLLQDMEALYEGYAKSVKSVLEQAERGTLRGVLGPVAALLTVPERFALAVEIALGAAAQHLVVETEQNGKAVLQDLRRREAGRVTCLPLDALRGTRLDTRPFLGLAGYRGLAVECVEFDPRYEGVFNQLLGRVLLAENLEEGLALARRFSHRHRIVTLDGQVLAPGGAMTGGSTTKRGGIITRATELEGLLQRQTKLHQEAKAAEVDLDAAKQLCQSAAAAAQLTQEAQQALAAQHAGLASSCAAERLRGESLRARLEALEIEQQELKIRSGEAASSSKQAREKIERMSGKAQSLVDARLEAAQAVQTLRNEREALQERIRVQSTHCAVQRAEASALETAIEALVQQLETLEQDARLQARESQALDEELLRLQAAAVTQDALWENLVQRKQAMQEKLAAGSAEKLSLEGQRGEAERGARAQNEALLRLQRALVLQEQQLLAAEQEEERLLAQLWSQYELSHEAARAIAQPITDHAEAEKRVTSLRGEIRALGQLNLGAVEEYARVRERFDYLDAQKCDVEAADASLCGIIEELTAQMKEIFKREFLRINAAFAETFAALFGGGKGELSLEDANDVLSCGIEIRVSPPGKSLRSLSLLSGGEKALCAIAIYFAILKIRPTPFCVLDEIEAALDDANVLRFASYLRSMAGATQFIVITHRRGTMEEADLLYGVTMEQQGISRLLRLRLGEGDALLAAEESKNAKNKG